MDLEQARQEVTSASTVISGGSEKPKIVWNITPYIKLGIILVMLLEIGIIYMAWREQETCGAQIKQVYKEVLAQCSNPYANITNTSNNWFIEINPDQPTS